MESKLYLFTGRFPYSRVENFLEDEIIYLSKNFNKIYIIPFKSEDGPVRSCPDNCVVLPPIIKSNWDYLFNGAFNLNSFPILIKDLLRRNVVLKRKRLKVWLTGYVAINCLLNSKIVRQVGRMLNTNDVVYSYWGKWANALSIFWGSKVHFISRFHGDWDLWEEKYDGYAPLRSAVAKRLEVAVFISQKGKEYFDKRYPGAKTMVYRLGTRDVGVSAKSIDGVIRVMSCSTVYPLKRVDLILKSVLNLSSQRKVEWTHLGGGVDYEKLKQFALSSINNNLSIKMVGQVAYTDVLSFYQNYKIDVFVNLSTNEGVPVSIMEAISCDVPIVATDVGGTAEVVVPQSGILVSPNPTPEEVSAAICDIIDNPSRFSPREFWKKHFVAEDNYSSFARFLSLLSKENS